MTMNSWKSIGASECAPPFITLAIGTGNTFAFGPPKYLNSGMPIASAVGFPRESRISRATISEIMLMLCSGTIQNAPHDRSMVRAVKKEHGLMDRLAQSLGPGSRGGRARRWPFMQNQII